MSELLIKHCRCGSEIDDCQSYCSDLCDPSIPASIDAAEKRGFVQGVAWGIALQHRYNLMASQMLRESGLKLSDFVDADVVDSDLKCIKELAR